MTRTINLLKIFANGLSLLLILFSSYNLFSQKTADEIKADSLISILPTEIGEERIQYLHDIVLNAKTSNSKKALKYARVLIKEIVNIPDSKLKAKSFCQLAETFDQTAVSPDSVRIFSELCHKLGNKVGHKISEVNGLYRLGSYYRAKAEFETALAYYHKAIDISENEEINKIKANCLHGIGVIKDIQKKYDEAIEYFEKSKEIGMKINDHDVLFISHQSRAISKFRKGDDKGGMEDFLKAKRYAPTTITKIDIRSNLSYAHTLSNNLDSAQYYLVEASELAEKFGSVRQRISCLTVLMEFHIKQGDWDSAFPVMQKREKLIVERKDKNWLRNNANAYTRYFISKGDYKQAYKYQSKYISYNDSILNEKNQYAIKDLEEKYENEKKQILIEEQELAIKNKNMQRNLILLMGLLGILFLLHRIRKNKQIESQRKIINQKEIDKLRKENTIMNLSSMIEGQHAERKRIAQDLHDGLGALLSSAKLQLSNVKSEITKLEEMAVFSNAENLIDNAYQEVRRISHDMMPGALVNLGLLAAVEDLADQINESNKLLIQAQWYTDDSDMDEKTKVSLYHIIQEAVTNAVKHSEANKMIIQLSKSKNQYQLSIEDDGKGFDGNDKDKHGIGLNNIESRVDYLNGNWEIISTAGEGVCIEISVPISS